MHSKKMLYALLLASIFSASLFAQNYGTIAGTVTNSLGDTPLKNVKIEWRRSGDVFEDSLFTDSLGRYTIDSLVIQNNNNRFYVLATLTGYVADTQTINFNRSPYVDTCDISMDPVPVLIPIASPTTNPRPTFQWYAVSGATSYTIQINTENSFRNPIISTPLADTAYTPLIDLPITTIYWRVSAVGDVYSEVGVFTITDPNTPILIPYEPDPTQERRPTLMWYSVAGASAYQILIDDDEDFSSILISTPLVDTSFTPLTDLPVATIYWKVKSDLSEIYSEPDEFTILSDTIPILYAFSGATINERRPVFRWKPITSATYYTIMIDDARSFNSPVISTPVADTTYTPLIDLPVDTYFWRVSSSLDPDVFSIVDSVTIDSSTGVVTPHVQGANVLAVSVTPNPVVQRTTIHYILPAAARFTMAIFDMEGTLIRTLSGENSAGSHSVVWDCLDNNGERVGAGIYLLKLTAGKVLSKKVIVMQ